MVLPFAQLNYFKHRAIQEVKTNSMLDAFAIYQLFRTLKCKKCECVSDKLTVVDHMVTKLYQGQAMCSMVGLSLHISQEPTLFACDLHHFQFTSTPCCKMIQVGTFRAACVNREHLANIVGIGACI